MARKKTLPHRRLKKKARTRPAGTGEAGRGGLADQTAELAPARRMPAVSPGPKGPAVTIDFKDIELYVRRELVRIAVVAVAVLGLIFVLGTLIR